MFKTTKTLIIAVLLLLTISLFGQEDSTKAIVKDDQGISTGMTKSEFEQFKKDYYNKMEKLGMFELPENIKKSSGITEATDERKQGILNFALGMKINLNGIKKFKNEDIDIVDGISHDFVYRHRSEKQELAERILYCDIIFIGEVTDSINIFATKKPNTSSNSYFKVRPLEILMGGEKFNNQLPEEILIYSRNGNPYMQEYALHYKLGGTSIFMINDNRREVITINNNCLSEGPAYDLNKSDQIKELVKVIIEINDKQNFYKRSYK